MTNFYNMYEFMNMISYYAEQQGVDNVTVKGIGKYIHTLRFATVYFFLHKLVSYS